MYGQTDSCTNRRTSWRTERREKRRISYDRSRCHSVWHMTDVSSPQANWPRVRSRQGLFDYVTGFAAAVLTPHSPDSRRRCRRRRRRLPPPWIVPIQGTSFPTQLLSSNRTMDSLIFAVVARTREIQSRNRSSMAELISVSTVMKAPSKSRNKVQGRRTSSDHRRKCRYRASDRGYQFLHGFAQGSYAHAL